VRKDDPIRWKPSPERNADGQVLPAAVVGLFAREVKSIRGAIKRALSFQMLRRARESSKWKAAGRGTIKTFPPIGEDGREEGGFISEALLNFALLSPATTLHTQTAVVIKSLEHFGSDGDDDDDDDDDEKRARFKAAAKSFVKLRWSTRSSSPPIYCIFGDRFAMDLYCDLCTRQIVALHSPNIFKENDDLQMARAFQIAMILADDFLKGRSDFTSIRAPISLPKCPDGHPLGVVAAVVSRANERSKHYWRAPRRLIYTDRSALAGAPGSTGAGV